MYALVQWLNCEAHYLFYQIAEMHMLCSKTSVSALHFINWFSLWLNICVINNSLRRIDNNPSSITVYVNILGETATLYHFPVKHTPSNEHRSFDISGRVHKIKIWIKKSGAFTASPVISWFGEHGGEFSTVVNTLRPGPLLLTRLNFVSGTDK